MPDAMAEAALLVGDGNWHTGAADGVRAVRLCDGPTGVRRELPDGTTAPATCFPTAATLGASWDRDLVAEVGAALGVEAAAGGVDVLLAPGVNIKRTPLCGRNFEYLAEDPLLSGILGAAYVTGLQSSGVGASLKHFAANNQEYQRLFTSVRVDERTLREIYLPAFERIVAEADPWTVMCAYNRLNGVHASQHRWLLTDLLRDEWGYRGLVVSDWGAVHDPVAAVAAGLDLQMPEGDGDAVAAIRTALASGGLAAEDVSRAAGRVRSLAHRAGPAKPVRELTEDERERHDELARRAAAAGTVLLRNDGTLPLAKPGRILIVGRQAAEPVIQGGGSSTVVPRTRPTLLSSLAALLPGTVVDHLPGYDWERVEYEVRHGVDPDAPASVALRAESVQASATADLVIACVGHPMWIECEGYDRRDIDLPADQIRLLEELVALDVPVVVVVTTGSAVALGDWQDDVAALLSPGFGGEQGPAALAEVLTGRREPGGRLAETWPLRLADVPGRLTYPGSRAEVVYGEGVFVGYRGYDALGTPVRYPFGHGLGYTTIEVTGVRVAVIDPAAGEVAVLVDVRNTGSRPGSQVVQVYVSEIAPVVQRPPRELRGFAKEALAPGESREVEIRLTGRSFAFYDTVAGGWQRHPGRFEIAVGTSSRELSHVVAIDLPADPAAPPFTDDETLGRILQRQA